MPVVYHDDMEHAQPSDHPWTTWLLGSRDARKQLVVALCLAAIFGLALGSRHGPAAMLLHAVGVPLGLGLAAAFSGPALVVGCAHAGLAIDVDELSRALLRAVSTTGLVLAGLSPATALIALSAETHLGAALAGIAALTLSLTLGQRAMWLSLNASDPSEPRPRGSRLLVLAFSAFMVVLNGRLWWLVLPALGGGA
jgi:hypothetical protein